MSDPQRQPVRSIMPADGVRKRERESETIESPDETASNGLPTPNGAGPANGNPPATNGTTAPQEDKPIKPHKPLNRVPRMLFLSLPGIELTLATSVI